MNNTINSRTPEEIKKGLECCSVDGLSCSNCSYCVSCDADIHALERDALAYIQQLENHIGELTEMVQQLESAYPKWISVKDRLPEHNTAVIVAFDDGHVFQALYAYDGWDLWDGCTGKITHWMPLPEPPKEVE